MKNKKALYNAIWSFASVIGLFIVCIACDVPINQPLTVDIYIIMISVPFWIVAYIFYKLSDKLDNLPTP